MPPNSAQRRTPPTFMVSELRRRIGFGIGVIVFFIAAGMAGFHFLEGISWLESFYYTVSVLTTLGLPIIPQHRSTELFTALFAIGGIGFFLYAIGFMAQTIFSREFQRMLVRRKALQRMKELRKHYIICGFGRIGEKVARDLVHASDVVVIERDEAVLARMELDGLNVVRGDASSEQILDQAGIQRARALIAVTGSDAENVLITMTAHQMAPNLPVITRCEQESNSIKMSRAGATRVVTLHDTGAAQIALAATKPFVIDLLALATGTGSQAFQIVELLVPEKSPIAGQSLRTLGLGSRLGVIVIGIKPAGDPELRFNPPADAVINPGDMMIAVGRADKLQELETLLAGN